MSGLGFVKVLVKSILTTFIVDLCEVAMDSLHGNDSVVIETTTTEMNQQKE